MASNYLLGNIGTGASATNLTPAATAYQANQASKPVYTGSGMIKPDSAMAKFLDRVDMTTAEDSPFSSAGTVTKPTHAYGGSSPVNSASQLDYYLADISKHYGMDKATAYQEALSNSAYQRAVADLRSAGLNPVLAMGKVNPADTFAGSSGSSGGGGFGSRRSTKTDWVKVLGQVAKVATSAAAIVRVAGMFA